MRASCGFPSWADLNFAGVQRQLRFWPEFQNRSREDVRCGMTQALDVLSSVRAGRVFCVVPPLQ